MALADKLTIDAAFLRVEGETCDRCGDTSTAVRAAVATLTAGLAKLDIPVVFHERALEQEELAESNTVRMNGRSLEEWLGAERVSTDCPSCSDLVGESVCCSAMSIDGSLHESLTEGDVVTAGLIAVGVMQPPSGCCS